MCGNRLRKILGYRTNIKFKLWFRRFYIDDYTSQMSRVFYRETATPTYCYINCNDKPAIHSCPLLPMLFYKD